MLLVRGLGRCYWSRSDGDESYAAIGNGIALVSPANPGGGNAAPIATPLLSVHLSHDSGETSFDLFDRYKGLASDRALTVLVDKYGFIWIGGNNGLHRFDGHSFYSLDRDPSVPDSLASRISLLLADTSDALWIGNQDGVLQRLDRANGRLERIPIRTTVRAIQAGFRRYDASIRRDGAGTEHCQESHRGDGRG